MSARVTTFIELAQGEISRVVIPRIQRDYAQGRTDEDATRIRGAFLKVLKRALLGEEPAHLDFVYGDVTGGTFAPASKPSRRVPPPKPRGPYSRRSKR